MGAVVRVDPAVEHARARAALGDVVGRVARMVREAPDPSVRSGLPGWSVGDVGAHLAAVYLACGAGFTGESVPWDLVLPKDENAPLAERIAVLNAASVQLVGPGEREGLGELLRQRGEAFLQATEGMAPETPVSTPWYGSGVTLDLGTVTGLMLSESLVHGLDFARGAKVPWPIEPDHARLVLGQVMPAMMPMTVNAEQARGVRIAFDLAVKGGPRLAVEIEDGAATVVRDAGPRRYDCRITADPVAFLLVSFERTAPWKAALTGKMRAGGRKPWLASRLGQLIGAP
ncbi:maleylpyruvate isomerase N-terminal domain-containing protein [Streptomyces sp. NPDC050418]|uniref:maleylpyruvate isomerase N-terminal domain-containing protein n=1 Tax=Streptomyces sp. NPDC050418 TaxID=3365612 RepID=UPI0037A1BF55